MRSPFACEVCRKAIFLGWFGFFDARLKCGACCNPPRRDWYPVAENHDGGDEDDAIHIIGGAT